MSREVDASPRNRRKSPRRRVFKSAMIAFNERHSTLPCTVRDLSEGGARLTMASSVTAPSTFVLIIDLDGSEVDCRVLTRSRDELRVEFCGPVRRVPPRRTQVVTAVVPVAQSLRRRAIHSAD